MKHVVLNKFTITKLAKYKQILLVLYNNFTSEQRVGKKELWSSPSGNLFNKPCTSYIKSPVMKYS